MILACVIFFALIPITLLRTTVSFFVFPLLIILSFVPVIVMLAQEKGKWHFSYFIPFLCSISWALFGVAVSLLMGVS